MSTSNEHESRELAVRLYERGALGRAELAFRKHLTQHPNDLYGHHLLIQCFRHMRKEKGCRDFYARELSIAVDSGLGHFVSAEMLMFRNHASEAYRSYVTAVERGLKHAVIPFLLGSIFCKAKMYKDAFEYFESALALDSGFLPALNEYALQLFANGRFDRLELLLESTVEDGTSSTQSYADGGMVVASRRNMRKALDSYLQAVHETSNGNHGIAMSHAWTALTQYPENLSILRVFLMNCYLEGTIETALMRIQEILESESMAKDYAFGLLNWYSNSLENVIALNKREDDGKATHALQHYLCGLALMELGDTEEAKKDFETAHTLHPWLVSARTELAKLALKQGHFAEVESYANINAADRDCARRFEVQGGRRMSELDGLAAISLIRRGDFGRAATRAAAADSCSHTHFASALISCQANNPQKGAEHLRVALDLDRSIIHEMTDEDMAKFAALRMDVPDHPGPTIAFALKAQSTSDPNAAIAELETIAALRPEDETLWLLLGEVACESKDTDLAKNAFDHVLKIYPNSNRALSAVSDLFTVQGMTDELLELADRFSNDPLPIEMALLSMVKKEDPRITDTAAKLLQYTQPWQRLEVPDVLELFRDEDLKPDVIARALKLVSRYNFRARDHVAWRMLRRGMTDQSRQAYDQMLADDCHNLGTILRFGITHLPKAMRD